MISSVDLDSMRDGKGPLGGTLQFDELTSPGVPTQENVIDVQTLLGRSAPSIGDKQTRGNHPPAHLTGSQGA
jgi:hypothetical protein